MKICILSDEDIEDYNPSIYFNSYDWDFVTVTPPVEECVRQVAAEGRYDVFLNICEGADDDDTESGLAVVQALEEIAVPFTGADSKFYNPTREQMQDAATRDRLNFAHGFNAKSASDLERANKLRYPLIVKHPNSFGSAGLIPDSKVESFEQLYEQFQRNVSEFGAARVEEFIEGREVSCLVVDNPDDLANPFAYSPIEVKFPAGESFMHAEVKWLNWDTIIVPLEDLNLVRRVQEVSRRMYQALGRVGYTRVDIRVRPNGELVILEINPNCGILYYGPDHRSVTDLPISWDKDGHDGFLDRIFRSALLRHKIRSNGHGSP